MSDVEHVPCPRSIGRAARVVLRRHGRRAPASRFAIVAPRDSSSPWGACTGHTASWTPGHEAVSVFRTRRRPGLARPRARAPDDRERPPTMAARGLGRGLAAEPAGHGGRCASSSVTGRCRPGLPGLHWLLGLLFLGVGSLFVLGPLWLFTDRAAVAWPVRALSVLLGGAGVGAGLWVLHGSPYSILEVDRRTRRVGIRRWGLGGRQTQSWPIGEVAGCPAGREQGRRGQPGVPRRDRAAGWERGPRVSPVDTRPRARRGRGEAPARNARAAAARGDVRPAPGSEAGGGHGCST